jgi:hypothetical protein
VNTDEAIECIQEQIRKIAELKEYSKFYSKESTKWRIDTLYILEDIFGKNSHLVDLFKAIDFRFHGILEHEKGNYHATKEYLDGIEYRRGMEKANGLLESAIDLLKRKGVDAVYEGKDTPKEASEILKIISLIENGLRKTIRTTPKNESEIQDKLETLFIGANFEFTREKERIQYSSKTYQPDFVFAKIETVVEVKFCNRDAREKELIREINDYIVAFKTKYPNLIFVVYDLGIIRDLDQFKKSFEKQGSVIVKIIKH